MPLSSASDPDGLIEADIDMALLARAYHALVDANLIAIADLAAQFGAIAVDGDSSLGDPLVRLAAGAQASFADVFIQSHGVVGI
jgi:hypothetical protein